MNKSILFYFILFLNFTYCFSLQSNPIENHKSTNVHFFTFGDSGTGDENQYSVAKQTQETCKKYHCDFGLLLGDNFYEKGVASIEDPQWKSKFQGPYSPLKIPIYALIGNHDWRLNPKAQIDYSLMDPYWKMPSFEYSFTFPKEGSAILEIFVINSMDFDTKAKDWLKGALSQSQAPWKILAFHHPILNNGSHHPADQMKLWPKLAPIVCGKVDLLLSGHEHLFSHLRSPKQSCGIDQVILGTGGRTLYEIKKEKIEGLETLHSESSFGLGFFEVDSHEMKLSFIRQDGKRSYSYSWKKN
ncbi:MAG: metallophosphoesterase [Deltaproteobacteria bacterium]|nr:metallophosphoesterase [Deltaproteobacteria bacterium]